jgi:hypothetical protein
MKSTGHSVNGAFDTSGWGCVDLAVRGARVEESLPRGLHGLEMAQRIE